VAVSLVLLVRAAHLAARWQDRAVQSRRVATLLVLGVVLGACSSSSARDAGPAPAAGSAGTPSSPASPASPGASGSGPAASGASPSAGPALTWGKCPSGVDASTRAQCATLVVPLDRTGRVAGTVGLQLIRRKATGTSGRLGSLLINPGGPGGSTVTDFDFLYDQLSTKLRERFDVVGWDPRGVGRSSPVRCVSDARLDVLLAESPDTTTPAGVADASAGAKEYVRGCESHSSLRLPFIGTRDTARDMDAIRAAVGDAKTTYLGYSYGTELGYSYASLFPDRVRALVLDGATDPAISLLEHGRQQTIGFQNALYAFLDDCAAQPSCAWKHQGGVRPAFSNLLAQVKLAPLRTTKGNRVLTASLFTTGVAAALYDKEAWGTLQQALESARQGDGTIMLFLADALSGRNANGTYDNLYDAFTTISCLDNPVPDGTQPWIEAAKELRAKAPDFADGQLATTGPGYTCSLFNNRPTEPALPPTVTGAPPALIIGATGDPATPLVETQGMARAYQGSVLLTRKGEGHTSYGASDCVRRLADRYLIDVRLPATGTVCGS
jgi:pimeloyl-ACP methyl ester carboxylesterase